MQPKYDENFTEFLSQNGLSKELINHIITSVNKVNAKITEDTNLGSGFQIGHSYFCNYKNGHNEDDWWNEVINYELSPLLQESGLMIMIKLKR